MKRERMNINGLWTKVVKGEEGWSFAQVIENEEKIKVLIDMTNQTLTPNELAVTGKALGSMREKRAENLELSG